MYIKNCATDSGNSLLTGMKVVILGDSEIQHPDNILNEIVPNSISVLQVTPSRLKILGIIHIC